MTTGASREITSAAVILYAPLIAAGLLWVVWHWRNEMAAWLRRWCRSARSAAS